MMMMGNQVVEMDNNNRWPANERVNFVADSQLPVLSHWSC